MVDEIFFISMLVALAQRPTTSGLKPIKLPLMKDKVFMNTIHTFAFIILSFALTVAGGCQQYRTPLYFHDTDLYTTLPSHSPITLPTTPEYIITEHGSEELDNFKTFSL